jgi:GNAT superfamily N-acetyltransferase
MISSLSERAGQAHRSRSCRQYLLQCRGANCPTTTQVLDTLRRSKGMANVFMFADDGLRHHNHDPLRVKATYIGLTSTSRSEGMRPNCRIFPAQVLPELPRYCSAPVIDRLPEERCICLQPLQVPGACKVKRLYVGPAARGMGLGRAPIGSRLWRGDAGYLAGNAWAIAIYRSLGFAPISPYWNKFGSRIIYLARHDIRRKHVRRWSLVLHPRGRQLIPDSFHAGRICRLRKRWALCHDHRRSTRRWPYVDGEPSGSAIRC